MIPISLNPMGRNKGRGRLPAGYIELEYLESTGTQWIDTGFKPGSNTVIKGKTTFMDIAGAAFGVYEAGGAGNTAVLYISALPNIYLYASDQNKTRIHLVDNVNTPFTAEYSYDVGAGKYLLNGNTVQFSAKNNWTSTVNMPIFCRWLNGYGYNSKSKLYYFKMYDAGKLVRNFIPALDPTGRPCMFDTVTQQPFYNNGTGEFLWRAKLPKGYTAIEYLESTGTQWIDTGIYGTERHGAELKYQFPNLDGSSTRIFGGRPAAAGVDSVIIVGTASAKAESSTYLYLSSHQGVIFTSGSNPRLQCDTNIHTAKANLFGDMKFTIDDISGSGQPSGKSFTNAFTLNIFRFFTNGAYSEGAHGRVYYCKITEDARLVRNFIPALDASNRPCMYDLVKRKTYYNQGTGEFKYA